MRDGTDGHICLDSFRFIKEDGSFGIPNEITNMDDVSHYGQDKLEAVFNVKNISPNSNSHWCAWGTTIITLDFGNNIDFRSYKFIPHANSCTNDPQGWRIWASHDSGDWIKMSSEDHDCPILNLSGWNEYTIFESGKNIFTLTTFDVWTKICPFCELYVKKIFW